MSSSLLGTFQTDWITGRSLETVFFFVSFDRGGSFCCFWEFPEKTRLVRRRMRGNGGDKTIEEYTIQHLHNRAATRCGATVKVILFSLRSRVLIYKLELARWKKKHCCASPDRLFAHKHPHEEPRDRKRPSSSVVIWEPKEMRKRNALALNAAVVGAASFFQCYASRISAYLRGNLREILFFT